MEYQRNVLKNILLWKKTTMYFKSQIANKKIFKLTLLLVSGKKIQVSKFTYINESIQKQ